MILKPIPLNMSKREMTQEKVMREGWVVLWDGTFLESPPQSELPPIPRKKV